MTHGSLFSGIGGFDLAAEWMGWENKFHCEWNEFGQKVLNCYWPESECFTDITKSDFTKYANRIDVLTGGFPCQPYSLAGKRKGKEDERHLWPEMLRAIKEIRPRWVVGENVFGLVNWSGGLVFHEVQADLEAEGYEVFPYVLPAVSVNAPHRRDRIWFVAYSVNGGYKTGRRTEAEKDAIQGIGWKAVDARQFNGTGVSSVAANTDSIRFNGGISEHEINTGERGVNAQRNIVKGLDNGDAMHTNSTEWKGQHFSQKRKREFDRSNSGNGINGFENFPTQSPICTGDDGLPTQLDGITFSKWRNESIKAAGNAIVPQVVYQIFKSIKAYELQIKKEAMGD